MEMLQRAAGRLAAHFIMAECRLAMEFMVVAFFTI